MKSQEDIEERIKELEKELERPDLGDHFKSSWEGQLYILKWTIAEEQKDEST